MQTFENSVFINCPFDPDYDPILQAIVFCIVHLGYYPRLSKEVEDAGQARLETIQKIIEESKYSIHDLSRCQAKKAKEISRLNMPFELGMDFGCKRYGNYDQRQKRFLILDEQPYRLQKALSDVNGSDIQAHRGDYRVALEKVRNWIVQTCGTTVQTGPSGILTQYADFQSWHYQKQRDNGFSEGDIKKYPTMELMNAMLEWHHLQRT